MKSAFCKEQSKQNQFFSFLNILDVILLVQPFL